MKKPIIIPNGYLNVAAISNGTRALGPGFRAVVWVKGCPLNCNGCLATEWIPFKPANLMTIEQIVEQLDINHLDGITFSGGEPMEQANELARLAEKILQIKDIDVICFTGYRYERLVDKPPNDGVEKLLSVLDVLIDGPYISERNDSVGLRGSSNQRIIYLTPRLQNHNLETQNRRVEVTVSDGELSLVGIPTPSMNTSLDIARSKAMERIG